MSGRGRAGAVVLVVEDHAPMRAALRDALEDEGLEVEDAADGFEAVSKASERRPALVLLDPILPGLDGVAVAERLRELCGQDLPILAVSASDKGKEYAAAMGAYRELDKPVELTDLMAAVRVGLAAPRQVTAAVEPDAPRSIPAHSGSHS